MPIAPPTPCTKAGCANYATGRGRCDQHKLNTRKPNTKRLPGWEWERIRKHVLKRDGWLCLLCLARGHYRKALEVDHRIPLSQGGSNELDNLQSLCIDCHSIKSDMEANISKAKIRRPAVPVTLVCGPPGAGKTTYCQDHMQRGDVLIDFDHIVEELSGETRETVITDKWVKQANHVRLVRLDRLHESQCNRAWVTMSLPTRTERQEWQQILGADVVLLVPDAYDCENRILQDARRGAQEKRNSMAGVQQWFKRYSA
jgi:hypothetical protein